MGDNAAYAAFEEIVIKLEDLGALTPEVLDIIGNTWRGTDIDSGGSRGLRTREGRLVEEVVVSTLHPGLAPGVVEDEGPDWDSLFYEIASRRWDWR